MIGPMPRLSVKKAWPMAARITLAEMADRLEMEHEAEGGRQVGCHHAVAEQDQQNARTVPA